MPNTSRGNQFRISGLTKCIVALVSVLWTFDAAAQPFLNNPESVVFDQARNRYLVSNTGDGAIVAIDSMGVETVINDDQTSCRGLHLEENNLYAACDAGVAVIDMETDTTQAVFAVAGNFLNDITGDDAGSIYTSDSRTGVVYKIDLDEELSSSFAEGLTSPNGLLLDAAGNRLLLCSFMDNAPIQAISLDDGGVTTVVETTLSGLDGMARDDAGRIYVSSWGSNTVYRFDAAFSEDPEVFSEGHDGPADIFFNPHLRELAIPNFNSNSVTFVDVPVQTSWAPEASGRSSLLEIHAPYPHPVRAGITLKFEIGRADEVSLHIFDIRGRRLEPVRTRWFSAGSHAIAVDLTDYPPGAYIYSFQTVNTVRSGKMLVVK